MAFFRFSKFISLFLLLLAASKSNTDAQSPQGDVNAQSLISCLVGGGLKNVTVRNYSRPGAFDSLLNYSLQNLRYAEPGVQKPYALIVPESREQVQKAVQCCIQSGWQIVVRSGGHSYEGLSYTSQNPNFVVIDFMKLDRVDVDMESKTAWVESGATIGQLYAAIAEKTNRYSFPAGVCPTIGVGGHFSGGGLGLLTRIYGLSADHVINAVLVNARGEVVDRKRMGNDVFWAIRGGGGGSWGVVVAWQIRLVKVPANVTVFNVNHAGSDNVTRVLQRWQDFAPNAHKNLYVRAFVFGGKLEVKVTLNGMFLGSLHKLVKLVNNNFPEMGLVEGDCKETDWIGGVIYTAVSNGYSADLRNRYLPAKSYFKVKSDFVTSPISALGLVGAWKIMEEQANSLMILAPLGGAMNQIPSYQIPFPHRLGYLYDIQYIVTWDNATSDNQSLAWIRKFYDYMAPYVSKSPRVAYVNYVDLDLGTNTYHSEGSGIGQSKTWGEKYFGGNFERLVYVKSKFDPMNIFRNAQSIPSLPYQ